MESSKYRHCVSCESHFESCVLIENEIVGLSHLLVGNWMLIAHHGKAIDILQKVDFTNKLIQM